MGKLLKMPKNSVILGSGCHLPSRRITNNDFLNHAFYKKDGTPITKDTKEVVKKLEEISGIAERRYIDFGHDSAQMGYLASEQAIQAAGIDREAIGGIILAHNFGNLRPEDPQTHLIPNMAAMVKNRLGIKNPQCVAFDLLFGCPGWLQAMIQAHLSLQMGVAEHILVVGVETMSPILEEHDLDGMLFGDGAGAVVLSAVEEPEKRGILSFKTVSHCEEEVDYLNMGPSCKPDVPGHHVKMQGRMVYRYAVQNVPSVVMDALNEAQVPISHIKSFLLHQANEKMLRAIVDRLLKQNNLEADIDTVLPLSVQWFGNSSVATIPTLLDMILRNKMPEHSLSPGDEVVFGAVGAGMHANAMVYRW